ncbi:MAG: hypothetical protein E7230_02410 [Clostridiales bacterium]|nr:hypothetical protein [Clostridiales bacterium]MBR0469404.1 helix-turn-helix domain-containing protein [Mogibacterium sp.]
MASYTQEQICFENEKPYEDIFADMLDAHDADLEDYRRYLAQSDDHWLCIIVLREPFLSCDPLQVGDIYSSALSNWGHDNIHEIAGGTCVMITRGRGAWNEWPETNRLGALIEKEYLGRGLKSMSKVCVGRPVRDTGLLLHSLSDAFCVCGYIMIRKPAETVITYDDLGVLRILFDWDNRTELRRIYYNKIEEIDLYDKENNTEYLDTITSYCKYAFSVNTTARKMHMHYNTVVSRLMRLKEISGFDLLNDAKAQFDAYTCVMVYYEYLCMGQFTDGLIKGSGE